MPRQCILTAAERSALLALPIEKSELIRLYTFSEQDLSVIKQRRGDANRLGFAVLLCALRYPGQASDIRGLIAMRVLVARNKVDMNTSFLLPSPKVRRKKWDLRTRRTTAPLFNVNGTGEERNPMKRKSPRRYDTIGCVLLWIAVVRPHRRTAIRVAIAERDGKAQLE
jgi:Domain of unknown function (DUF4158)